MQRYRSVAFLLLLAAGCQSPNARYVLRQPGSGVIAIPRDTPTERGKAVELIQRHVGPNYVIEKEEEVITDPRVVNSKNDSQKSGSTLDVSFALGTRPNTEYRIHYHRYAVPANTPTPTTGETTAKLPSPTVDSGIVQASATLPATSTLPEAPKPEPEPLPSSVKKFMPLTFEGCQGR